MRKYRNTILAIFVFICSICVFGVSLFNYGLSPVSDNKAKKEVVIKNGTNTKIAHTLKDNKLIKSTICFRIYIRLSGKSNLKAATYKLSENMGTKKIVSILASGKISKDLKVTFSEGKNINNIAKIISEKTNNKEEDILNIINDKEYIDSLIDKYWFLTSDIKNSKIYYPLEGYLFPDTYNLKNKDVSTKEIIETMLDEMDKKISPYKEQIEKSDYSIHELMTLASIIELEVAEKEHRKKVAGVFINRIEDKWSLGSDATTYYGSKIFDWKDIKLTSKELNDCSNQYNTRCRTKIGLPVGPISNPGIESIEAVINPEKDKYYYFVTDCKGELYLTKNENEHLNTISKLKASDNWCA